jgi:hypothetical protein
MLKNSIKILMAALVAVAMVGCGGPMDEGLQQGGEQALKISTTTTSSTATKAGKTPAPAPAPAVSYKLSTTDAHVAGVTPTWKSSFAIATTYDLFFATEVTGRLSGHHTETVFVSS